MKENGPGKKGGTDTEGGKTIDRGFEERIKARYDELRKGERSRLQPASGDTYDTVINARLRK